MKNNIKENLRCIILLTLPIILTIATLVFADKINFDSNAPYVSKSILTLHDGFTFGISFFLLIILFFKLEIEILKYKIAKSKLNKLIYILVIILGLILGFIITNRSFTIITPDKIHHSSLGTLFITKEYDYSKITQMDFRQQNIKGNLILDYSITFDEMTVDVSEGNITPKDIMRDIYSKIKMNSKHVKITYDFGDHPDEDMYKKAIYISNNDIYNYK